MPRGPLPRRPRSVTRLRLLISLCAVAGAMLGTVLLGFKMCNRVASPSQLISESQTAERTQGAPPRPTLPRVAAGGQAAPAGSPSSLDGTIPDGAVTATADGHLVVNLEVRRLFDYFLAATGEEPTAAIRARIIAVLRARLPATAADEGVALLDRYLQYRDAARQLTAPGSEAAGLAQVHALRARWFSSAEADAMFGGEEAATAAAIARRDVMADPALDAAERQRRLAEIDARTPPAERAARAAATAPIDEMASEAVMRAAGASDAEIEAARTRVFGPEAAARLAELDHARAAWDARLAEFRAARAALLADPRLSPAERQRQLDELFTRSFTPPERIRVEALDRIAGGSSPAAP